MKNGPDDICIEPRCKNRRRYDKRRKKFDRRRCHKCDSRRKRKANPMWAKWRQLKDHAKARKSEKWPAGIPFRLGLGTFILFAKQSRYLNRTGLNGHCITVDRINDDRGYFKNNIQPMTRIKNAMKQARRDAIRMKAGFAWEEN